MSSPTREEARVAMNEAVFLAATGEVGGGQADGRIELFCECERERCIARLHATADEYAAVRRTPGRYLVLADHAGGAEVVLSVGDYAVVETRAPGPPRRS